MRRVIWGLLVAAGMLGGFSTIMPATESKAEARYYRRPVARAAARGVARVVVGARPYGYGYRSYGYGYYGGYRPYGYYGPGIGVGVY